MWIAFLKHYHSWWKSHKNISINDGKQSTIESIFVNLEYLLNHQRIRNQLHCEQYESQIHGIKQRAPDVCESSNLSDQRVNPLIKSVRVSTEFYHLPTVKMKQNYYTRDFKIKDIGKFFTVTSLGLTFFVIVNFYRL